MKQKVIIKSNKYGLIVHMDPDAEYTEILKELREKFTESARFFKDATMAVTFEGRILTKPQEEEVIGLITDVAHIHIVCIFDTNENTERLYKKVVEDSLNSLTRKEGQFYKGTLRQRQVLETEQSIIILGDVEFGATVVSKGNIVVLGAVRGTVHAGATGDRNAFITALSMRPHVMKIAPCESFFTESQLVDGKCPDCGRPVQPAKEEAYFFKMSKYADRLIEYINTHPEFIQPVARKNEMMNNFLLPGLQDLCVSRTSFKWGIPVDFDPKHVVYVWLDALTNYITGIGYHCDGESDEMFNKNWPADLHLIGKDIIRFHTIYWPIFLMALGLPLPKQVFGHPWLLQGDGKMSKSKGNVLYADELVDFFGVDAVRYFVLHEMPFENDGVISWELMVERLNSDLANTLGNLVNRTISMTNKYFGGTVTNKGVTEEVDADLKAVTENTPKLVEAKMEELRVADAITEIFNLFKRCNKYIDETMPWALAKDESKKDRLETVLWNLIQSISEGAKLLESFMPETAEKILAQLGGGHVVEKPEILFQRLDLEEVMKKVEELHPKVKEEKEEEEEGIEIEEKPEITFEDFEKMQFQVGEIISCEAVQKSKKLLCSQVKIGSQVKQIVSGIKAHYTPEEMVGKKVMVLVNLKPAKLAGVLSEGMLLCAEDADGNLALMTPEKKMPAGAEIC